MKKSIACLILIATTTSPAAEPAEPLKLPERVITPTRTLQSPAQVGSSFSFIDASELDRRGSPAVLDALRTLPGLEISRSGSRGGTSSALIRGGSSAQTLMLVDGVRVNPGGVGGFDLADLGADNLERVEVVRGPQGMAYGSEAMAGVINVITRRGAKNAPSELRLEGGSDEYRRGSTAVRGAEGSMDYSLSASWLEQRGLSQASERAGNREKDPYELFSTVNRIGYAPADDVRIDLLLRGSKSELGLDGFDFETGPVDDPNYLQEREFLNPSLQLALPLGDRARQSVVLGWMEDTLTGSDPDTEDHNFHIRNENVEVHLQTDVDIGESQLLTAGLSYADRTANNRGNFREGIDLVSVFVQDQWHRDEVWFLTAGARLDENSEFGEEVTWRGTMAVRPEGSGIRVHGSAGSGFRAPSLNELYFPDFGNPDLRAEESLGFDLGVELGLPGEDFSVDVTGFGTRTDDLVAFDSTTFLAGNIAEAEAYGVEVEVRAEPAPGLELVAGYTWTDSEDRDSGDPLPRRPEHRTTARANVRLAEGWTARAGLVTVADRVDSDGSAMDDYELVEIGIHCELTDRVAPYLRIENLLDQRYEEITGFTSPGITVVGGVRMTW